MINKKAVPKILFVIFIVLALSVGYLFGSFVRSSNTYPNEIIELHVRYAHMQNVVFFLTVHRESHPSTVWFVRLFDDGLLESWGEYGVGLGAGSTWANNDVYADPASVEQVKTLLPEIGNNWSPVRNILSDDYVIMISYWDLNSKGVKDFHSYSCYQSTCQKTVCEIFNLLKPASKETLISNEICVPQR
jgi:hypothetical protein